MKKTILLILAVLPIVLLVVIAFAGQILSYYQYIAVERVEFVDRAGSVYTEDAVFTVKQGGSKETKIVVYPLLATNQKVSYRSEDESICTVDENGVIHGVHWGSTTVTVETADGKKTARLAVKVTADVPFGVTLSHKELSMNMFGVFELEHEVDAPVSIRNVTFTSSDPTVATVDAAGKVTARKPGTAIITVTTVSGGLTDTCTVTVNNDLPHIYFDASASDDISLNAESGRYVISVSELDILGLLILKDPVKRENVKIEVIAGKENATVENGVLKFNGNNKMATLRVIAVGVSEEVPPIELKFLYTDI